MHLSVVLLSSFEDAGIAQSANNGNFQSPMKRRSKLHLYARVKYASPHGMEQSLYARMSDVKC